MQGERRNDAVDQLIQVWNKAEEKEGSVRRTDAILRRMVMSISFVNDDEDRKEERWMREFRSDQEKYIVACQSRRRRRRHSLE